MQNKVYINLKLVFFIIITIIFIPIVFLYSIYFNSFLDKSLFKEKENKILTIITLTSKIFSENNFEFNIKKNNHNFFKNKILELKTELPIAKDIFILYKEDNRIYNFLDEKLDVYKISDIYLNYGFIKPTISKTILSDKSSKWILAFAPIKKVDNKDFILCMEIYIDNIENLYFSDILKDITIFILLIILISFYLLLKLFFKPLDEINNLIIQMNQGNLELKIDKFISYYEFHKIFISLKELSRNISNYIDKYYNIEKKLEENNRILETTSKQNKNKNYQLNNLINVLNKINLLIEKLINKKNINDFSNTIVNDIIDIFDAQKSFLAKYIPNNQTFKILSSINTTRVKNNNEYKFNQENIILNLIDTKNTINIYDKSSVFTEEFDNAVISPIIVDNEIEAFILIMNKENSNEFSEEDETTINNLSKIISALWNSLHLFELASLDTSTNLYLRRYLERNLEEEIIKAVKNHNNLSLIMLDIDNLKYINEEYGRDFGDNVIKLVIDKVKTLIKPEYIAAKYSSQIICILLPDTSFLESLDLANNIKNAIDNIKFEENELKITVSLSIDSYPEKNKNPNTLLKSCEELLYLAKNKGKNRIEYKI
ncbi:MAG: hypothetical protein KatS3mg068_0537 [Candidatus Sericytochromatia bacterium]|nr:MAG: hypothetical protein KatS3mg068_0537 [Candidatus Sericytochromatia bacterium]